MTNNLIHHYSKVLQALEERYDEMVKLCSSNYIDRMIIGLNHWIQTGKTGYLSWGILHFRKP